MAIDSVSANASSQVAGAIRNAAQSTGASFEYLLTTARIESNLNPAGEIGDQGVVKDLDLGMSRHPVYKFFQVFLNVFTFQRAVEMA